MSLRLLRTAGERMLTWALSALVSNRSLAVLVLAGCGLLAMAPWLRPPISRDFRGVHIPWGEIFSVTFLPEVATETPRPWRWDSVATPVLIVVAIGIVVVLLRPRWMSAAFGLLLAVSLPAMAVALWNYPTLIESFDSEMRDRALLRAVFRQQSEHMLAAGTPDRLATLGNKATREDLLLVKEHPSMTPLRYSVFVLWLVVIAVAATLVAARGPWLRRMRVAAAWTMAGVLLAIAATWPRWLSEYHWARFAELELASEFSSAQQALDSVVAAMPSMEHTARYWFARGRLSIRQKLPEDRFQAYFLAQQALIIGDLDRARALLEPYVLGAKGSTVQRDLLSGILAHRAAEYVSDAKHSAAELSWSEAAAIAPWKISYALAHTSAQLAADPHRAAEMEQQVLPRLSDVGDRMVSSDFCSLIGDAYFTGGHFAQARAMYDRAMDLFHLPKYANVYAQEGRLGM